MWVPGSLVYLVPAFVLAMRVFSGKSFVTAPHFERIRERRAPFSFAAIRYATQKMDTGFAAGHCGCRHVRGWFGKQVTPLNLAGTLPWGRLARPYDVGVTSSWKSFLHGVSFCAGARPGT